MRTSSSARPVLGDDVGVGLDEPAHDDLAQTECALDHDAAASPLAGSAVNITPERSESTMRCTTTAIAGSSVMPCVARYASTRSPNSDAQQSTTRSISCVVAAHVGERLVHPGERRTCGVLGGGRRPHGDDAAAEP